MANPQFRIINSPLFLLSVGLLALNDWYLKANFHNALTGKISDFAGLFAFTVFIIAWLPRYREMVGFITTLTFVWWKSPFSEDFIDWWSNYCFPIHRVVDETDLMALLVIPFAVWYSNNYKSSLQQLSKFKLYFISACTCIVFMATSATQRIEYLTIPALYIVPTNRVSTNDCEKHKEYPRKMGWYYNEVMIDSCYSLQEYYGYSYSSEAPKLRGDYEINLALDSLAKHCMLFTKAEKCLSHYQIDSVTHQRINQTDSLGNKQGVWKIGDVRLGNIVYWLNYKNDQLYGYCKVPYNYEGGQSRDDYPLVGLAEGKFMNGKPEGWWNFTGEGKLKKQHYYRNGEVTQIKEGQAVTQVDTYQELKVKMLWGLYFAAICVVACLFFIIKITNQNPVNTKASTDLHLVFILLPLLAQITYMILGESRTINSLPIALFRDTNTFKGILAPYLFVFINIFVAIFQEIIWAMIPDRFFTQRTIGLWALLYVWAFMLVWQGRYYWYF
jgi:hypothetical protein